MDKNKLFIKLIILSTILYLSTSVYSPYISTYYQIKEFTKMEIGVIIGSGILAGMISQPLCGIISDKYDKRKLVLQILCISSAFFSILFKFTTSAIQMILVAVFYNFRSAPVNALTEAITVKSSEKNDFRYSIIRIGGTVGFALGPVLAAPFVTNNYDYIFIFTFIGYILLFIAITLLPDSCYRYEATTEKQTKKHIYKTNDAWIIIILCIAATVGITISYSFFGPALLELGCSVKVVGILAFISAVFETIALLFCEQITEKFDAKILLTLCSVASGLMLLMVSRGELFLIVISYIIQGILFMLVFYTSVNYISQNTLEASISQGQSILSTLKMGFGSAGGNILGGYMLNRFGTFMGLKNTGFLIMIATALIYTIIRYIGFHLDPEAYEESLSRFGMNRKEAEFISKYADKRIKVKRGRKDK